MISGRSGEGALGLKFGKGLQKSVTNWVYVL